MTAVALGHAIEGAGPRVVLLHPVGLDRTFLAPIATALSRRYSVMRVDARGHGQSPVLPTAEGLGDFADDLHALLAARAFAPCAVVGFSFGGMVAQTLALRHPQDVAALVPCACPSTIPDASRAIYAERAAAAERGGMAAVLDATLARWFTDAFRERGGAEPARRRLLANDVRGWAAAWRAMAQIDTAPHLHALRAPTLCIAGAADKSAPPEVVAAIARAIPGARFATIPDAPHMLFIEQPEAVAREVRAFLDEAFGAG